MATRKRAKQSRMRGSHTHGWGSKKKHRGSGNRGGHGFSGTGKKADSRKPSIWKNLEFFGKHGFAPKRRKDVRIINVSAINEKIDSWLSSKLITKENDLYVIDLNKIGYDKLLGKGRINKKIKITVGSVSEGARDSIIKAGGEVIEK
jgi:large subunit ribosomal protein L15